MRYEDFVIQLGPETPRGVEVRGSCPVAGEARVHVVLPLSEAGLAERFAEAVRAGAAPGEGAAESRDLEPADAPGSGQPMAENARRVGSALFEAVFRGPIRRLLERSLARLEGDDHLGLRIRLQLDLADELQVRLHSLPWELLYKAETGDFLGLSRRTPIVRYLELARAVRSPALSGSLRVLALAPEPADQPILDLRAERQDLETLETTTPGLEVSFLEAPELGALRRALVEREFHVLHVMGHGQLDPQTGRGVVHLEGGDGRTEAVDAAALVAVVGDFPSLRLAVLNACSTGRAGEGVGVDAFSGVAPALMRAGLPAVVAMQRPITDAAAIAFGKALYARLVAGDPVDAAVSEGRQAIHASTPTSHEWSVPALFTRTGAEVIFGSTESACAPSTRLDRPGIDHLRAGNFEEAIQRFRHELAASTNRGICSVALGVALARGRRLRQLPYRTAQEMHRLLARALTSTDAERVGAAALLALKIDYFEANAVREPPPTREDLLAVLGGGSWNEEEERLLSCLTVSDKTREAFGRAGLPGGRTP